LISLSLLFSFFLSVLFKRISFCKPTSFVRHKAVTTVPDGLSIGFSPDLMYGEQCRRDFESPPQT
jgi:hypothetical protein